MIACFEISNYGPFRDKAVFSMVPSALSDRKDSICGGGALRSGLLKAAAVFGANASGKSCLFEAFADLQNLVSAVRPEGTPIPGYRPFRLSRRHLGSPVGMRLRLDIGGVLHEYSVSFVGDRIAAESLRYSPNGRSALVFSRGGDEERMDPEIASRLTGPTSYLYLASGFNNEVCNAVLREIMSVSVIHQPTDGSVADSYYAAAGDPEVRSMVEAALDAADLGIRGFVGEEHTIPFRPEYPAKEKARKYLELRFIHSFDGADADPGMLSFPSEIESNGTLELFALMGPIAEALKHGRTVIIDEFGSDLHPMLTRWVMNLFNGRENASGAQLIVNTHDLGLMDIDGFLRRDEIWFCDKDRMTGASSVRRLSDFIGVRKNSDVRKDYLLGRYDGRPAVIGIRKL